MTSVALSAGTTGLTVTGGPITSSGTLTIGGTLGVSNGGTGLSSLGSGVSTALGNATNAASGLVALDSNGKLPAVDGSKLTGISGGSTLAGFRNKLINGTFLINQRGVSGTVTLAAGAYGHDRWKAGASGCTYSFTTVNNITTLTITAGSLQQVIEGNNIDSASYILSWQGTAQGRVNGTSYGASGNIFTLTGGNNTTIEFGTGTLSRPQFEAGTASTAFELRPYSFELGLAQRYCLKLGGSVAGDIFISGYSPSGFYVVQTLAYPVTMRMSPSVLQTGSWANVNVASAVFNAGVSSLSVQIAATAANVGVSSSTTGTATYLLLSAEM